MPPSWNPNSRGNRDGCVRPGSSGFRQEVRSVAKILTSSPYASSPTLSAPRWLRIAVDVSLQHNKAIIRTISDAELGVWNRSNSETVPETGLLRAYPKSGNKVLTPGKRPPCEAVVLFRRGAMWRSWMGHEWICACGWESLIIAGVFEGAVDLSCEVSLSGRTSGQLTSTIAQYAVFLLDGNTMLQSPRAFVSLPVSHQQCFVSQSEGSACSLPVGERQLQHQPIVSAFDAESPVLTNHSI
ncbi:uncharacterized protein EI97DRAFT_441893 [Westerdykella ornata]|uniref:Uncharacterized protein n=1 Tax=Westerdykella ornata TaxID=318751 RepID=A0A6A6JM05_WESOR|nr:uncharacterized protein EI97DRAFT_441893 [Westerdykella ornata]KAF2277143.1 hypothetical protein EI97DRAFT_441893 [Westerdykella ornata]